MSALATTARAERQRRAAFYGAAMRGEMGRRMTRDQVRADAAVWDGLCAWLACELAAEDADWPGWATATRKAAQRAMLDHRSAPDDAPAAHRAHALATLARNIAITAQVKGGVADALDQYAEALRNSTPAEQKEAA